MAHAGGRPTKRTKKLTAMIADSISHGLTDTEAAAAAGIDRATIVRWNQIPEFIAEVESAKAKRKLQRLKVLARGTKAWTSQAWLLERSDPKFRNPALQQTLTSRSISADHLKAEVAASRMIRSCYPTKQTRLCKAWSMLQSREASRSNWPTRPRRSRSSPPSRSNGRKTNDTSRTGCDLLLTCRRSCRIQASQ
jgi:hypothetical protein